MFRWTFFVAMIGAMAVGCGVAVAANGVPGGGSGNSPAAQLCKNGGWQSLVRADQTPFLDQGECVAYAAQGGVPVLPGTLAQRECAAIGGIFSTDPDSNVTVGSYSDEPVVWTCNLWPETYSPNFQAWGEICFADGGDAMQFTSNRPPDGAPRGFTCFDRPDYP